MGLESLPHMALGNTKRGMTQVVVGNNTNAYSYSDWLSSQKDEIIEAAYQNGRRAVSRHVIETNGLCYASHIHTPTVRSLGFFSVFENISGSDRQEQKLLAVRNPVGFGALVYLSTQKLVSKLGARVAYYAPSKSVGLELAEKGLLNRSKFSIDYKSKACIDYANEFESQIKSLENILKAISRHLDIIDNSRLKTESSGVGQAVGDILQTYHACMNKNVRNGLTYTVIEDEWLAKKIPVAKNFASQLLLLYRYAEKHNIRFTTNYPRYNEVDGFNCMKSSVDKLTMDQYALYSEVFALIKGKAVYSSAGNRYQLGYIIPQMEYAKMMNKDLSAVLQQLNSMSSLKKIKAVS